MPRVYIDAYSSYHTVYLFLVDPTTFGVYRCQVSSDFPVFDTVSKTVMAAIPTGSIITPATHSYVAVSDPVQLNCSISGSFPKPTITWYVNTVAIVSPEARLQGDLLTKATFEDITHDDHKYHNSVMLKSEEFTTLSTSSVTEWWKKFKQLLDSRPIHTAIHVSFL